MVQIKGSSVQETVQQIKRRAGEAAFQNVFENLDGETKKLVSGDIFASTWYPLDLFARFLEVEVKVLADGNEELIEKGSAAVADRQLRGIYRAFVRFGSPEFVIKRLAAVHATYFNGVAIDVQIVSQGRATIKYVGFEKQHRIMGFAIVGFFRKALEISGAKDIQPSFVTPIEDGKGYAELSITWA